MPATVAVSTASRKLLARRRNVCGLVSLLLWAVGPAADAVVVESGPLTVDYAPRPAGLRLAWDGVAISRHSELVVTTPPWAPHYYVGPNQAAVDGAKRSTAEGAEVLTLTHRGEHDSVTAAEQFTLQPDGSLTQTLEIRFGAAEGEALVQWQAAALNPSVLMGMKFRAELADGSVQEGVFPVAPQPEDPPIVRGFRRLEVASRLGPLCIEVASDRPLVLYDHRAGRWSNPDDPYYWFGDLGTRISADKPVKYAITYRFPKPTAQTQAAPTVNARLDIAQQPDAQSSAIEAVRIIPQPKELRLGEGTVVAGEIPSAADAAAAWAPAAGELRRAWQGDEAGGTPADASAVTFLLAAPAEDLPPEGYHLNVSTDGITLAAADTNGFFNAVQTLKQLAWRNRDGRIEVRAAEVRDWPALRFRGAHIFTGGQGPALHERLVRDVFAACKLNRLVLECEYVKWDAFPEIHHPQYGMSKADVRRILDVCRATGVEVIPLVQALGHCQWMFVNDQHLDLAEDPEARYAYCVTNPQTYDFLFTVFEEALALFRPRVLHIGHDEYADRGRVPYRETSQPYSIEELFMMDTRRLHDWLAQRNVRTMMWGDMLLAKGEAPDACNAKSPESAAGLRAELPDDILIADWHYVAEAPAKYTSLHTFQADGHAVVASTWSRPGNIVGFSQAAAQQQALGLLQTTWAGYSLDPGSFAKEMPQYIAHVLAAEAAWNADRPIALDLLGAGEAFFDWLELSALPRGNRAGWTADLAPVANVALAAASPADWFGLGPAHDLSAVPAGDVRLRGVRFRVAPPSGRGALALAGRLSAGLGFPQSVSVEVNAPAAALVLLVTTEFACPAGTPIATVRAEWADGPPVELALIYGRNIMACTDLTPAPQAPVMWRGRTPGGEPVALRAAVCKLPAAGRVTRLTFTSGSAGATPILVGLSGFTDGF